MEQLGRVMTLRDVAELSGLCWDSVKDIAKRRLRRDYGRIALKGVRHLSIDEIYVGKRRGYYTLVLDLESGRILWVSPGRGKAGLRGFWRRLRRSRGRIQLINESIGWVLLRYLQISAPQVAVISVSPEFLRDNPEVSIQLGSRSLPVEPGWHFGSLYPNHPDRIAVYDFIPDALLCQVANLRQFLGMLVFDKWTGNADGRQAIFFRSKLKQWSSSGASARPGFLAWMIDQGFLFNGPHWDFPDSPLQGLYHRPVVYEPVTSLNDFEPWLNLIQHFPPDVIDEAFRQVPLQWLDDEEDALEQLLEKLLRRARRVPDLLEDCRRAKPSLFPNWRA